MKYLFAVLCVVAAVAAQVLVKYASLNEPYARKWFYFIFGSLTAYGLTFLFQTYVFRFFPLSKIGPAVAIAVMVVVFGCGLVMFQESIQIRQAVGVIMGVVSIYLIMA